MNYWLMKCEPSSYSIDDLKRDKQTSWDGVRNYQARNFMRDQMKVGDLILFYHSNADPSGVAGIARVCREAHPDLSAFDPKDKHYDPDSLPGKPVWMLVDIEYVEKLPRFVSLSDLKSEPRLKGMMVLQKGSRLSVQPVGRGHFEVIRTMGSPRCEY